MSTPMTPTQFVAQLKRWGIPCREDFSGWQNHNRGNRGNGWGPVHGIVQHHTGADNTSPTYLYTGSNSLPGPLCHVGNDANGVLHLIGWGRTNHAGGGDQRTLNHVIAEDYGNHILSPAFGEGKEGAYDGNGVFYGIENIYSGSHPMTPKQYDTAVLFSAAVSEFHHWTSLSTIGHGEWSDTKHDPSVTKPEKLMDMVKFRHDIQDALNHGPHPVTNPAPPKPTPVHLIPPFPGTLRPGMNSKYVTLLDKQLIYAGFAKYYKSGPGPYFGTSTANAVKAFLLKHKELWTGNEPDSIVGPKTWEAIFKAKK
jgi:hypothetical protein